MSIECIKVGKGYKHKSLFRDVDITFKTGICNCITGENGSGKTTLLKIIAGLEKADSGHVQVNGTCTYSGSNPYMLRGSVIDNIMYPLSLRRQAHKFEKNRVNDVVERLGLQGLEHREALSLSSGEKQKVALGRALVWNPDILLLDEPTANIDKETIESIEDILLDFVKDKKHTLLLVSHDLKQTERLKGDIWTLKDQGLFK